MRWGVILLVALGAACSGSGSSNQLREREMVATVSVAQNGVVDCEIRWNGAPVSLDELTQRSRTIIEADLDRLNREVARYRQRGIHIETDQYQGPYVRVEAARDLPYSCFGPVLRALQRGTFFTVTLRPTGERDPDQRAAYLTMLAVEDIRYPNIVRIGAGGRMTWNGESVDLDGLRQRARRLDTNLNAMALAVAPSVDADFATVYQVIKALREEKIRRLQQEQPENADFFLEAEWVIPTLSGCAGTVGPVRDPPVC
jgi:hypothetical protein